MGRVPPHRAARTERVEGGSRGREPRPNASSEAGSPDPTSHRPEQSRALDPREGSPARPLPRRAPRLERTARRGVPPHPSFRGVHAPSASPAGRGPGGGVPFRGQTFGWRRAGGVSSEGKPSALRAGGPGGWGPFRGQPFDLRARGPRGWGPFRGQPFDLRARGPRGWGLFRGPNLRMAHPMLIPPSEGLPLRSSDSLHPSSAPGAPMRLFTPRPVAAAVAVSLCLLFAPRPARADNVHFELSDPSLELWNRTRNVAMVPVRVGRYTAPRWSARSSTRRSAPRARAR